MHGAVRYRHGRGCGEVEVGVGYLPIEDHGVIGNLYTAALVGTDGTIDWLCLPAFDSPSVFCSILDDEKGGHFALRPVEYTHSHQLYLPDTNVLLTRFFSPAGLAETLDFMPIVTRPGEHHRLVRNVRVIRGKMNFRVECLPAFDYARRGHTVSVGKSGAVFASGDHCLGLATDVRLEKGAAGAAGTHVALSEGEKATFVLAHLRRSEGPGEILSDVGFEELLHSTLGYWRRWLSNSTYQGRWREIVHRSALVLKLMVYDPTGALVALIYVGFEDEARKFMGWLKDRCHEDEDGLLQPLYGIDGRKDIAEMELTHLSGYMNSYPVRLGNGAHKQRQLDLYGAVLDAAYLYNKHGAPLDYDLWTNLQKILDWLSENWREPDEGIWEVRGGRRQFVSSKLLSWVALERAGRIARQRGLPSGDGRWIAERDAIYEEVMEKGWNPEKNSFVQYYGSDALDASLLMMPLVKFVGPTDPRWISTLDRIQRELAYDTLVKRYRTEYAAPDGLEGGEGSFSLCSFWLVECLTQAGRLDEARLALEKMFSYANHLGLYAEELGHSGEALGNFPQALTHLALISAAVHLDRALGTR